MRGEIFREYDIRGLVERDLTSDVVRRIGQAVGTYLRKGKAPRVAIGRDVRLSSPAISSALSDGLCSTGAHVLDVGVVPTPALYFSLHELDTQGGVMITGSHNPPEYNGLKVCAGRASLYGPQIQELKTIIEKGSFASGSGHSERVEVLPDYSSRLTEGVRFERSLKVVMDAGNGTGGIVAPRVMEQLGCDVVPLYCEPDGNFPHHHPDPTVPANLVDLQRAVKEEGAAAGIAFDGDADRIGVVDEEGDIIWGDRLLAIYARDLLRLGPAKIVLEVKCSQALVKDIELRGGTPIMWKAGHSLIKQKMREENALLGGEMSGHMFFADRYFGFDDAIYAAVRFLEILSRHDGPASTLLADLPRFPSTPEIRVDCADEEKFEVVDAVRRHFSSLYETIEVDGVRVLFGDGWGLVRASNTQPALVLRFEAETKERLSEIRREITDHLRKYPAVKSVPEEWN